MFRGGRRDEVPVDSMYYQDYDDELDYGDEYDDEDPDGLFIDESELDFGQH